MDEKQIKCRDCKYFMAGENLQLCQRFPNWEITKPDNDCRYLPEKKELTCSDCWCIKNDYACFGTDPDQSVYFFDELCPGFTDKREYDLYSILSFWKSCGMYDRDKINNLIDSFEKKYEDLYG